VETEGEREANEALKLKQEAEISKLKEGRKLVDSQ